jgi:hypothetical protein
MFYPCCTYRERVAMAGSCRGFGCARPTSVKTCFFICSRNYTIGSAFRTRGVRVHVNAPAEESDYPAKLSDTQRNILHDLLSCRQDKALPAWICRHAVL